MEIFLALKETSEERTVIQRSSLDFISKVIFLSLLSFFLASPFPHYSPNKPTTAVVYLTTNYTHTHTERGKTHTHTHTLQIQHLGMSGAVYSAATTASPWLLNSPHNPLPEKHKQEHRQLSQDVCVYELCQGSVCRCMAVWTLVHCRSVSVYM